MIEILDRAKLSEIDKHIDALDRAEPDQPLMYWRKSFDALKIALTNARRIRDPLRTPGWLALTALMTFSMYLGWSLPDQFDDRLWIVVIALAGVLLVWEICMRLTFPVLNREGRVSALLRYYGAKDVDQQEEVF